jgi:hypothetical protein
MPLPPGRKDLPPLDNASAAPPSLPEPPPSALPETRGLTSATTTPTPASKTKPVRPVVAPAPRTDDLSNIGRR